MEQFSSVRERCCGYAGYANCNRSCISRGITSRSAKPQSGCFTPHYGAHCAVQSGGSVVNGLGKTSVARLCAISDFLLFREKYMSMARDCEPELFS